MAVAIRLARKGAKKRPSYRVVATDKRSPRDGRFIEQLGIYDPRNKRFLIDEERYEEWISTGAKPSLTVAQLVKHGSGGYLSQAITPEDPGNTGTFHTFRYTANIDASQSGVLQLVEKDTWEVLAETPIASGSNVWTVKDLFRVKDYPSIRVVAILEGLEKGGSFDLDDLWLNWTKRIRLPPRVLDVGVSTISVLRGAEMDLWVNVTDEYDSP